RPILIDMPVWTIPIISVPGSDHFRLGAEVLKTWPSRATVAGRMDFLPSALSGGAADPVDRTGYAKSHTRKKPQIAKRHEPARHDPVTFARVGGDSKTDGVVAQPNHSRGQLEMVLPPPPQERDLVCHPVVHRDHHSRAAPLVVTSGGGAKHDLQHSRHVVIGPQNHTDVRRERPRHRTDRLRGTGFPRPNYRRVPLGRSELDRSERNLSFVKR